MHVSGSNYAQIFVNFRPQPDPKSPARLTTLCPTVLPGRNDAGMGPANTQPVSAYYCEYNEILGLQKIHIENKIIFHVAKAIRLNKSCLKIINQ